MQHFDGIEERESQLAAPLSGLLFDKATAAALHSPQHPARQRRYTARIILQTCSERKNFRPDVAVTHLEAMRLGWRDGFACGVVELAVQGHVVVGLPMPYQNALSTTQPAVLLVHP